MPLSNLPRKNPVPTKSALPVKPVKAIPVKVSSTRKNMNNSVIVSAPVRSQDADDYVEFNSIGKRAHPGMRKLKMESVLKLAESISEIGLLHAITVDLNHRLVAGAHRMAALDILTEEPGPERMEVVQDILSRCEDAKTFKHVGEFSKLKLLDHRKVPVVVLDFDSKENREALRRAEMAENLHGNQDLHPFIRAKALELKAEGYEMIRGRPKVGQKALLDALVRECGVSATVIRKALAGDLFPEKNKIKPVKSLKFVRAKATNRSRGRL